jgi:hypothetical protein
MSTQEPGERFLHHDVSTSPQLLRMSAYNGGKDETETQTYTGRMVGAGFMVVAKAIREFAASGRDIARSGQDIAAAIREHRDQK